MKFDSKTLRETWLKFYESKGHVNIGAVSLIGDGTTGVMFNVAGMQPLMPYLLGESIHKAQDYAIFKVVCVLLILIALVMKVTLHSLK